MASLTVKNQQLYSRERIGHLARIEAKAAFLDEILSFIEDKSLGHLMEATENEADISLSEARRFIKPSK